MAFIQIINKFYKKNMNYLSLIKINKVRVLSFKPLTFLSFIVFFTIIFFSISNLVTKKNKEHRNNLSEVTKNSEFSNLTSYLISKINSPYQEIDYTIKNNDTIEKILKNYNIKSEDIKKISTKLKKKSFQIYIQVENCLLFTKS